MAEVTPTTAATAAAPTHLPLPPWHPVYSAFRRVVEGIQRRYAATALAKILVSHPIKEIQKRDPAHLIDRIDTALHTQR